jgi:hypothetical protein
MKAMHKKIFFIGISLWALTQFVYAQPARSIHVFFQTGSITLSTQEQDKLSAFMKGTDSLVITKILVLAYCDDVGKKTFNQLLSEKRAHNLRDLLMSLHLSNTPEIEAVGKGALPLLERKDVAQERMNNRRAEITVRYHLKEREKKVMPIVKKDTLIAVQKSTQYDNLKVDNTCL